MKRIQVQGVHHMTIADEDLADAIEQLTRR